MKKKHRLKHNQKKGNKWKNGPKPPFDEQLWIDFENAYNKYTISGSDRLKYFILMGHIATTIKKTLPHGTFLQTIKHRFPDFGKRSVQVAMKLARTFDIALYPALLCTCKENLHTISKQYRKEQLDELLECHPIFQQKVLENKHELHFFRRAIRDMVDQSWLALEEPSWELEAQTMPSQEVQSDTPHPSGWTEVAFDTILDEDSEPDASEASNSNQSPPKRYYKFIKKIRKKRGKENRRLSINHARLLVSIIKESALALTELAPNEIETDHFHREVKALSKLLSKYDKRTQHKRTRALTTATASPNNEA